MASKLIRHSPASAADTTATFLTQKSLQEASTTSQRRGRTTATNQQNNISRFLCLAAIFCGLMMLGLLKISSCSAAPPRYMSNNNAEAMERFISHFDGGDPEAYANIKRSASPFFAWGGKRAAAPAQQAFFHWGGKRAAKPAAVANPAAAAAYYDNLWNYYRTYLPFIMEESSKRAAAPRAAQFFSWGGRR